MPTFCMAITPGVIQPPLAQISDRFTDRFASTFYGTHDRRTSDTIASAYRELDAAKSDIERNNYVLRDMIGNTTSMTRPTTAMIWPTR